MIKKVHYTSNTERLIQVFAEKTQIQLINGCLYDILFLGRRVCNVIRVQLF